MSGGSNAPRDSAWSLQARREPKAARAAAGLERRTKVPIEAQADLVLPADRASALSILQAQDATRLQDLVPIRYGRMMATPFTFLRGAAAVMAADLAAGPRTDLHVQLCGDAHLSNFGVFKSPERTSVFDVNDFDETLPGPFEWDVKRLVASVVVAGRNNKFDAKTNRRIARATVAQYRAVLKAAAAMDPLALFYYQINVDQLLAGLTISKQSRQRIAKGSKKAADKTSLGALGKLTDIVDGRRMIVSQPPLIVRLADSELQKDMRRIDSFFGAYRKTLNADRRQLLDRYALTDLARKVVGVGSVGTRCWIALFESGDGEPLFLQVKEAGASVLEPYLEPSEYDQAGERVVNGQRLVQSTPDSFLGWARSKPSGKSEPPIDFYIRQLWDGKQSADVVAMAPETLEQYARACGAALARAHARSGDASEIAGYLGDDDTFDRVIATFAEAYADLTEKDYADLLAAVKDGQIKVVRGM
jgi:uncharacterized protein (DUF2252 family)